MSGYGIWNLTATLSCEHKVRFGAVPVDDIERLIPRRKDHSFAALRCPEGCGRRQVRMTRAHHLYGTRLAVEPDEDTPPAEGQL